MSDSDTANPAPRRSQREKKTLKPFTSLDSNNKRKRATTDDEADLSDVEDRESDHEHDGDEDMDDEEDFEAPKPKPKAARKSKVPSTGPSAVKKPRTTKNTAPKPPKTAGRKPKKGKTGDDAFDASKITKETKITADNPLFNATMNPSAALQSTAEDFLESLTQTPGPAQAELINCILRACGCNDSVDADEVMDYDGVVDTLDNFTESLKQENSPIYPLTSKLPVFKKFRRSLSEFIERVIASSAELGSLYSSDLMATLQTWVIAMSSSNIRSFRHTATVVALEVETALCDVAATVEKEAEIVSRQREGERKRKAGGKGGGKEKEFDKKAAEVRERRTKLAEFIKEFVDGVFVHRYRDLDPNIRAECVRAMGLWFKKYPAHFLDGSYLRYVGWVLSDASTPVRLEAVKSLSNVYHQGEYLSSLNHFTERFKPRLIEMATGDTELAVRVAVIQVLGAIDEHSLLEEDEREKLCLLIFDEEVKVRKAVSQFVKGVWEESVETRLLGKKATEKDKERAGVKVLAALLVKWGKALDKAAEADDEAAESQSLSSGEGSSQLQKHAQVVSLMGSAQKGRTALAVDALWSEVDAVSDWDSLLDILLLDHSAVGEEATSTGRGRGGRAKQPVDDSVVNDIWRLDEVEESLLLETLLAALSRARAEAASAKKGEDETILSDITRALIKGLPRLFVKYQTDEVRIAHVLLIPALMNLDMYLEMRMMTAYASLWDDVTKQFLSHSSLTVLKHSVAAICHFMSATSLLNTNSTKIVELEEEISSSLRDAVAGRDEIEVASFTEDEVLSLSAICARLATLAGTRDMTAWMEEDEGGKQSNAWDIMMALVERGRLGYREEEQMVEQALNVVNLHVIWKARGLTAAAEPSADEIHHRDSLKEQRDSLVEKLIEYAVGTQSNTAEGVKRAAFQILMNLHVLFCPTDMVGPDGAPFPTAAVPIVLEDEVQYRCAGFIQAEIERYAEDVAEPKPKTKAASDDENSASDDDDTSPVKPTKNKAKHTRRDDANDFNKPSRSRLEREYIFMGVVSTFLRAIRAGAIHVRHGAVLLAHYGRLGWTFDECSKVMVDVLREEGMYNQNPDILVSVISQAISEAFTLVLDSVVADETNTVALAKLLASSFVIRGAQLSIVRRIDSQYIVQVHTTLLTWIGKRLAAYEKNKNKRARKTAILFFRALTPLLATLNSREALKIKAHMDQVLASAKVEALATSKQWEPQRAYEKKLGNAMAKDKVPKAKGRKSKAAQDAAAATSDEEEESEIEDILEDAPAAAAPASRPKPRPAYRAAAPEEPENPTDVEEDEIEGEPMTPQARPRPKATYKSAKPASKSPEKRASSVVNGTPTPKTPGKRTRAEDEEQSASDAEDSPVEEQSALRVRKRVRH
ncbi:hypothetical protein HWV62_44804 [Athelia sp. TMB]|nr:hypothetical protein HWV62_44804 [Athelia sp. TMB]